MWSPESGPGFVRDCAVLDRFGGIFTRQRESETALQRRAKSRSRAQTLSVFRYVMPFTMASQPPPCSCSMK